MVQQEVLHVADSYQLEAALVRFEDIVTSQLGDGDLSDLVPGPQVPEPTTLAEVAEQVYDTVLHEKSRHLLSPQAPRLVEVHIQAPKYNGFLETFQGLL